MKLSEIIKEKYGMVFNEIDELIFHEESLVEKLRKNKLRKEDRELLIDAIALIRLGEY